MLKIDLKEQVTLVVGGSRGIGAAVVRGAADCGSRVAWTDAGTEADRAASDEMAKQLDEQGVEFLHKSVDCADEQATRGFVDEIAGKWGRLDNLVYCPGLTSPTSFLDVDWEGWKRHIDINLNGAYLATHAALGHMLKVGAGNVIYIASAAVATGGGGRADYVSGKAGLHGLNLAITKEFASKGIRSNIVNPSLIDTDLLRQRHPSAEKRAELAKAQVPVGRLGTPEDIASTTLFLISEHASYITGQAIWVDGGRTFCG